MIEHLMRYASRYILHVRNIHVSQSMANSKDEHEWLADLIIENEGSQMNNPIQ